MGVKLNEVYKRGVRYFIVGILCLLSISLFANYTYNTSLYIDGTSKLSITEIRGIEGFKPLESNHVNSEFTHNTYWIKITPSERFSKDERLSFGNAYNHYETVYLCYPHDSVISYDCGINQTYQSATFLPSFALDNAIESIYISVKSDSFLYEYFEIASEHYVLKNSGYYIIFQVLSLGFVLLVVSYILFLYQKSKKPILRSYAFYIISMFFMFFYISNLGRYLFWDTLPVSNSYVEALFSIMLVVSYTLLTMKVTNIKTYNSLIFKVANYFLISYVSIMAVSFVFLEPILISQLASFFPGIALVFILIFAIIGKLKKNLNGGLYLIGIFTFISSSFIRICINWGLIQYSIFVEMLVYLGIISELVIFTYVVIKNVEQEIKLTIIQKEKLELFADQIEELQSQISNFESGANSPLIKQDLAISAEINQFLHTPLTKREMEVLIELSKGGIYDEVSERLFISKSTLKTHIGKIYVKLDSKNRIDAINTARELSMKTM